MSPLVGSWVTKFISLYDITTGQVQLSLSFSVSTLSSICLGIISKVLSNQPELEGHWFPRATSHVCMLTWLPLAFPGPGVLPTVPSFVLGEVGTFPEWKQGHIDHKCGTCALGYILTMSMCLNKIVSSRNT